MRIAIVAESFLPHMNGVTGSVLRILEHLRRRGHQAVVVAAGAGAPSMVSGFPVLHLHSVGLPGYPQVRICLAGHRRLSELLTAIEPDVVHLASPAALGHAASRAASDLRIPQVAVFQTDVAGFAAHYGRSGAANWIWSRLTDIHYAAELNLAPSRSATALLESHGVERIATWGRGVDMVQFSPSRRDEQLRSRWGASDGRSLIGYVGRLAPEKRLSTLAALRDIPDSRLVIVGEGPERGRLQQLLPGAVFTGHLSGAELGAAVASLDVFVHPGENETFCQAVQEALAAGVPVVAPAAGGVAELVDPSRTGWLYSPGDVSRMRAAVADLASDPAKRQAFGQAATASVSSRSWEALGDALLGHYRTAIARSRVGS